MSKQRNISTEQILYLLINLREEDAKRDSFTDIRVNRELCKAVGLFNYKLKDTNEMRTGRLFLLNETQDGESVDVIYDENGRFIAWRKQKEQLQVARDIELDKRRLEGQLIRSEERERIATETTSGANSGSSDTEKAGEGRDLGNKEHEKNQNKEKKQEKSKKRKE